MTTTPDTASTTARRSRGVGRNHGTSGTRRRAGASLAASVVAVALALAGSAAPASAATGTAPGAPGTQATWTTGAKQGVGTSTTETSKVWYTLSEGTLSEVYYPRVDVANSRSLELIVTDGKTFADRESTDTTHEIQLPDTRSLTYRQVNRDKDGRYEISKVYVTDPNRSTVLVNVTLRSLDGGRYQVYAQYDPSLANSGLHDSASTRSGALVAEDLTGADHVASALVADRSFAATSNGYAGVSDGWTDLSTDFDLDDTYSAAPDGNVVQTARLNMRSLGRYSNATLALGFGTDAASAVSAARGTMSQGVIRTAAAYTLGWHKYLNSIDAVPAAIRSDRTLASQYTVAAMTLKAHEDKTYRGANIASLTIPWGEAQNANEAGVGGYHLVWARDLYQVATAQLAAGDEEAAGRSLDYLFDVQQKADGSFPQNTLLDGTPYWTSLQLDEVAFPIVLAWQLGRDDRTTWTEHVKRAADFLVARGPSTPQERWEEEGGYSPSTIAAEIAGLVAAADIARANGDDATAAVYLGVADSWQQQVEDWTFTTTGSLGDGQYYLRIDGNGDPDDGGLLDINNGGGAWDEREIVDGGFLDLVRLGVKPADDAAVASSLPELDSTISVDTPNGTMWYRYNHDGYGEKTDGAPYDGTGVGRLWPLLSGERGEYELANGREATSYLRTMAAAANDGYMIPEQVWDTTDADAYGLEFGEGTGSATPLAWSMAGYLRLAVSLQNGAPVETPSIVADRYASGSAPAGPALTVTSPTETTTGAASVTVAGSTDATAVYASIAGVTSPVAVTGGAFSFDAPLTLGANTVTLVGVSAGGGTTTVQLAISSTNFGDEVGTIADATGDDAGPGDYVYPTNPAFVDGAFDVTEFGVYRDAESVNMVATIAGDIVNPWGGNQISTQRFDVYIDTEDGGGEGAMHPGSNAVLEDPYEFTLGGSGFITPTLSDAAGDVLGTASILTLPASHQIVFSVPRSAFGDTDLAAARYQVAVTSHADANEGVGNIRPVYSREFWDGAPDAGLPWIQEYRFGGGAGGFTDQNAARDTDSSDPNLIDILVPADASQTAVLDWRTGSPVVLPYVPLG